MSKRTPTRDVFVMVAEQHDTGPETDTEPETPESASEPRSADTEMHLDEVPDSDDAVDTESAGHDTQARDQPPRRMRRRIVAILVGTIIVASVGTSAFLGWRLKQLDDTAAAGQAALAVARDYAVTLTTIDAADIDKNYKQALDGATGEFKDDFSQASAQLRQVLIDNKAAGNGVVVDAAVKSASRNKVEVLLFVDQSITNALNPSPRIDRNRVHMTMEFIDNHWLASQVDII